MIDTIRSNSVQPAERSRLNVNVVDLSQWSMGDILAETYEENKVLQELYPNFRLLVVTTLRTSHPRKILIKSQVVRERFAPSAPSYHHHAVVVTIFLSENSMGKEKSKKQFHKFSRIFGKNTKNHSLPLSSQSGRDFHSLNTCRLNSS